MVLNLNHAFKAYQHAGVTFKNGVGPSFPSEAYPGASSSCILIRPVLSPSFIRLVLKLLNNCYIILLGNKEGVGVQKHTLSILRTSHLSTRAVL